MVPAVRVPVTTVPAPVMVNERSTQSRSRACVAGGGTRASTSSRASRSSARPVAGDGRHDDRRSVAQTGFGELLASLERPPRRPAPRRDRLW